MKNDKYISVSFKLPLSFEEELKEFKRVVKNDIEYTNMTIFLKKQIIKYINNKKV